MEREISQNTLIKTVREAATKELGSRLLKEIGATLQRFRISTMLGERIQRGGEKIQHK